MANEHSQIVPSMQPTSTVADFKFWCQKVLPLVYDDSISYYEVLGKMVVYLNQVIDNINADTANVAELEDDFLLLQTYVNNFFDDIDQLVTYTERAEAAETAALSSAASAAESATNAASSAVNAATSSGSAATSALSAMDAKDAAVAAKTAAETALANAQTAATNAAASATAASGSATNAASSATSALQNFQLSDAARTAAQSAATSAESDAESAADSAADAAASAASADGTKAQVMIATEDSATATSPHSIGEFFRVNGVLYVATDNIQVGDTISTETNCRVAVVGDELSKLNTAFSAEETLLTNPINFTIQTGNTVTLKLIDSLYLDVGEYFITYEQLNEVATSTRNCAYYKKAGGSQINEFAFANSNKKAGIYIWKINITEAGYYEFGFWGHTLSAQANYKQFAVRKNSIWYSIGNSIAIFNNGFTAKQTYAANKLIYVFGQLYKTTTTILNANDIILNSNVIEAKISDFLSIT